MIGLRRLVLSALLVALPASAQESSAPATAPMRVPFGVGERAEYDIRYKKIHVGNGDMEVMPMDTVRGRDVWHAVFKLSGGIPFYHVNDKYQVWFDTRTLASLRYWQDIDEGSYEPKRRYEIFPDRREYIENDKPPRESVEHPIVDAGFLYFLRTINLRLGLDTTFSDFFMAERNPVHIKVVRKDTVSVPAGRFPAIVIQPTFPSKLFSEGGHAEVWLSDDANHIMLKMESSVRFGSLNLYLKSFRPSPASNTPLNRLP